MPAVPPRLEGVLETVLYYIDEARTERFYREVLGLRLVSREPGRSLFYRAGRSVFLLFDARETRRGGRLPAHGAEGAGHTCFLAEDGTYDSWKAHLEKHGVAILQEVSWSGSALSFYFHDPDGNVLEIANEDFWPR